MSQIACWPVAHQRQVPQLGMNEQTTWSPTLTRLPPWPPSLRPIQELPLTGMADYLLVQRRRTEVLPEHAAPLT